MVDTCCKLEDSVDICASFGDSDAETCCGHVLRFVEAEFAKKIGGLGGFKVFRCTALLHRCLDVHPSGIQSLGAIF